MADVLTKAQRRYCMSQIRSKGTIPEIAVRRITHSLGYRYRLHRKQLPGTPDLVFVRTRKVIFVNGCFWHRHICRFGQSMPVSNQQFWLKKFDGNVARDQRVRSELRRLGWKILTVWECQIKADKLDRLTERISNFLDADAD